MMKLFWNYFYLAQILLILIEFLNHSLSLYWGDLDPSQQVEQLFFLYLCFGSIASVGFIIPELNFTTFIQLSFGFYSELLFAVDFIGLLFGYYFFSFDVVFFSFFDLVSGSTICFFGIGCFFFIIMVPFKSSSILLFWRVFLLRFYFLTMSSNSKHPS